MNTRRQQHIEDVFRAALERPLDQRPAFIRQACVHDPEVHREVESLVLHFENAGTLERDSTGVSFSSSVAPSRDADGDELPAGTQVRGYRILDRVGRGGMGVVYRARQEQPDRVVALKVIRPELASGELQRRFEHEARVLGRLHHPGIAQIFEAGVTELIPPVPNAENSTSVEDPDSSKYSDVRFARAMRVPFFAMEYIRGEPLTAYAEGRGLDVSSRLELVAKICDAVHHAHLQGVIHRDLKPANILVDDSGQPKVLDFGIARAVDADLETTLHTSAGALIGTIPYMSPEQAGGNPDEVDVRSDVYALGVLAYELLTSRAPYDVSGKSLADALTIIRHDDPTPLRSVNRTFRGDIDTIVGRALEKDKTRRYASVADFANDIRRFMRHEPVLARRPTAMYQLRKFARRNRALVGGAAAVFVGLVLALIGTGVGLVQSRAAEQQARIDRDKADDESRRAQTENARASAVSDFLQEMLRSANPEVAGRDVRVADILKKAAEEIPRRFPNEHNQQAALHGAIGQSYEALAMYAEADQLLTRALELSHDALGDDHAHTMTALNNLASLRRKQGKDDEARSMLVKVVEGYRKSLGNNHEFTLRASNSLGLMWVEAGQFEKAEPILRATLDGQRRALGNEHIETLQTQNSLALLLSDIPAQREAAEAMFKELLDIQLRVNGPLHPHALFTMNNLAQTLMDLDKLDEAEALQRRSLEGRQKTFGPEHPSTVSALNALALVLDKQGKSAEAEPLYHLAVAGFEQALDKDHWMTQVTRTNLGVCLTNLHRWPEAEEELLTARKRLEATAGADSAHTAEVIEELANLYDKWNASEPDADRSAKAAELRELLKARKAPAS